MQKWICSLPNFPPIHIVSNVMLPFQNKHDSILFNFFYSCVASTVLSCYYHLFCHDWDNDFLGYIFQNLFDVLQCIMLLFIMIHKSSLNHIRVLYIGIWILEEKLRKNKSAFPLELWFLEFFEGLTCFLFLELKKKILRERSGLVGEHNHSSVNQILCVANFS